jgi:O-antigen ligase
MAMDLGMVVPFALSFVTRRTQTPLIRVLAAIAGILAVTAVVLSHSRGGFIGLCVALVLWMFLSNRRIQAGVVGVLLAIGLGLFAPRSFWQRTESVTSFHEDASAMGRVYAWKVISEMNLDKPLLGVGAGGFRYAWPLYAPPEAKRAYVAHNIFLDVLGELGLVGLIFFLLFVGGAAGGAFAAVRSDKLEGLGTAIAASVAGYLVCDLFSGYLLSPHSYVLFGLAACAHRIVRAAGPGPLPEGQRMMSPMLPTVVKA